MSCVSHDPFSHSIVFPDVTYALRLQPTIVVEIATDGVSRFRLEEKMPRVPRNLRAVTQALELENGFDMAFTNEDTEPGYAARLRYDASHYICNNCR